MIVDVSLADCNVVFAIDRGGLVGEDGPTHHGAYDIAYCRMIPGMRMIAPSDEAELVNALHTALRIGGPVAVRYPRGCGRGVAVPTKGKVQPVGESSTLREGSDVAILAFGGMVANALDAAEILAADGIDARVVDMRWVKPLDEAAIASAAETRLVVTVENGIISGGAGEGVLDALSRMKATVPTLVLGIDDSFVPHGKISQLLVDLGLDAEGIAASVKQRLA